MIINNFREIKNPKYTYVSIPEDDNNISVKDRYIFDISSLSYIIDTLKNIPNLSEDNEEVQKIISELEEKLANLKEEQVVVYKVRGLTPKEYMVLSELQPIEKMLNPPKKKKEVAPLDNRGKIVPEAIRDEDEYDFNDPAFKQELTKEWLAYRKRAFVYILTCGVYGFQITDDDIQQELGQTPVQVTNIDTLRRRLDQIAEIIFSRMDNRHVKILVDKIIDLTGVKDEMINFI